jgi:hypothetical protein
MAKERFAPGGGGGKGPARLTTARPFGVEVGFPARPQQRQRRHPAGAVERKPDNGNPFGASFDRGLGVMLHPLQHSADHKTVAHRFAAACCWQRHSDRAKTFRPASKGSASPIWGASLFCSAPRFRREPLRASGSAWAPKISLGGPSLTGVSMGAAGSFCGGGSVTNSTGIAPGRSWGWGAGSSNRKGSMRHPCASSEASPVEAEDSRLRRGACAGLSVNSPKGSPQPAAPTAA